MADLLSMDLAIFLVGTLAAAFVTALAGFAFGMIAAAVWLYALTPPQVSALIAAYALLVQGYAVWKLRHLLDAHRLMPFILGSAVGIPIGILALRWATAAQFRLAVGAILILFSLYNLLRPKMPEMKQAGRAADAAVGVLNGIISGATGLGGIAALIWSSMRGWTRRRAEGRLSADRGSDLCHDAGRVRRHWRYHARDAALVFHGLAGIGLGDMAGLGALRQAR